jgi:hypothetical protein
MEQILKQNHMKTMKIWHRFANILCMAIARLFTGLFNSCSVDNDEREYFYYYEGKRI